MKISKNFSGGNIEVFSIYDNKVSLDRELRDTEGDWFYWAFCVEESAGETMTFEFDGNNRIGYYGPAISYDLLHWHWLGKDSTHTQFTYHFEKDENKVYFAHNMIYSPTHFQQFAEQYQLQVLPFCKSEKGQDIPYIKLGSGDKTILLTARHHACESTGNYVLQGVLEQLIKSPIDGFKIIAVPFIDYDGVVDGDQGKNRIPHDHNRDYGEQDAIYASTKKVRQLIRNDRVVMGFDFHSPWHLGGRNDTVYIVQSNTGHMDRLNTFGEVLESSMTEKALAYFHKDDIAPGIEWNVVKTGPFVNYLWDHSHAHIALSLETPYFGTSNNIFSQEKAVETGHCFANAIASYIRYYNL